MYSLQTSNPVLIIVHSLKLITITVCVVVEADCEMCKVGGMGAQNCWNRVYRSHIHASYANLNGMITHK